MRVLISELRAERVIMFMAISALTWTHLLRREGGSRQVYAQRWRRLTFSFKPLTTQLCIISPDTVTIHNGAKSKATCGPGSRLRQNPRSVCNMMMDEPG
ncbi:hypothetical protein PpBr36_06915 [Pyricularia pennisetigena]|uniref:hypothetical protein n=1 Tax=Pyricularia pennisetigena TaxID=1578925 RepID=UPI0011519872|nr:hypothetical protein PpBr36_06915 [Pyricularia pennisetigena]TLS25245.1 hypothetical protein PpBr36_06915 [Pyricularia pennisetigena]